MSKGANEPGIVMSFTPFISWQSAYIDTDIHIDITTQSREKFVRCIDIESDNVVLGLHITCPVTVIHLHEFFQH